MRRIGGNIGPIVTPGASAINSTAGGVWTLLEVEYFKRTGIWPTSPTVPGAPTSLAASGGGAQISLTWTPPASTGGIAITEYVVEFTPSGGSASTVNTGSAASSYSLTGLTNGTTYTVRVAAVNAIGQGDYSGTATGTPIAGPLLVAGDWQGGGSGFTSSGLGSAASPLRLLNQNEWDSGTVVRFTPTASGALTITGRSLPNGDGGVGTWRLYRRSPNTLIVEGGGSAAVTRTATLISGVEYQIDQGNGGFDVSMYLTAFTPPGAPTSLAAVAGNAQASLTWDAPASDGGSAITDYAVQFSSNGGATWNTFADGTSAAKRATVTGLTNGTAYVFRVAAVNDIGTGSYTAASSSVTPDPSIITAEYLVVAGGGSGGRLTGGGGGAGGLIAGTSVINQGDAYTVAVGKGGASIVAPTAGAGNSGKDSAFRSFVAVGGGGGGWTESNGLAGGSGGGGGGTTSSAVRSGGSPTLDQGNAGGGGVRSKGGGGGGSGSAGSAGIYNLGTNVLLGGNGGNGTPSSITGQSVVYAAGGGGGNSGGTPGSAAGAGGSSGVGGRGGQWYGPEPTSGAANTGSGGGGSNYDDDGNFDYSSGAGAGGVVVIAIPGNVSATVTGFTLGTTYTRDTSTRAGYTVFRFIYGGSSDQLTGTITLTSAPPAFAPRAVVLTSGTSYSIPSGANSMKVWAIGGGGGSYALCDGGSPAGGGVGAVAVRTYSVTGGGDVTYSVGGGGGSNCSSSNPGGSTSVSYGGVSLAGGGGAVGTNGVCTNATTCGLAGNNVDGLNEAVTLSGSSISGRGAGGAAGPAPGGFPISPGVAGAVVLYFFA